MAANRISYFFDLSGPSLTVDSACSSSMSALHLARSALQRNESKMALVCGAKLILNPDMFMPSSELGFLGPSGRCKTFDAEADGYGRGEGIIALLVRPLQDALKSNDPIRAVIRGTRLNSDGRTQGITLPSASAQANNMRSLYGELGIAPDEIQYFEAHVRVLSSFFRRCSDKSGNWHCCRRSNRSFRYQHSLPLIKAKSRFDRRVCETERWSCGSKFGSGWNCEDGRGS